MLIRVSGYNSGVKEYLEEGVKSGREYTREELDHRLILYGDLDLTEAAYRSIPDRGQNRYTTFTLSFKEDEVSEETLRNITKEMRDFIMYAYDDVEYNFYAEAHIPKLKTVYDKRTGEKIDRKPHIHIVIPKVNLLSGNVSDVIGDPEYTEKYLEAFQEYINNKYGLASPREHVRVNPYNASDVLSRYKGDDFRGKNREFKQNLVREIIETDIRTREDFYAHVSTYGETKVVNAGKENEYIKVKLPDDAKFTTLKETIFNDSFINERKLSRPPLPEHVISERLQEWPMRSKEIKYIAKASSKNRDEYYRGSDYAQRLNILSEQQNKFYSQFGGSDELHPTQRKRSHERSAPKVSERGYSGLTDGLQSMSRSYVAVDREGRNTTGAVFLPGNARIHLAQPVGGNSGLRSGLPGRRQGGAETGREGAETGRQGGASAEEGPGERSAGEAPPGPGDSARTEGGQRDAEQSRTGGEAANPEGRESTGNEGESRAAASAGGEETAEGEYGRAEEAETTITRQSYPSDTGSRESQRYSGIPELGRHDTAIRIRGGYGTGRLETGLPVYARNSVRIPDVNAIERNTQRLFSDSVATPAPHQRNVKIIRRVMPRAPRNASYLAASLQRQQEQSMLTSGQRRALYQADRKYFETRRSIQSDGRLSAKDKTQLLGVLTFERLKEHQQIIRPQWPNQQESIAMGSEDIRKNIQPERKWRNFISGPDENAEEMKGAKERFSKMGQQMQENLGERSIREKVRIITAADLYTRKARLSDNIHYMDKSTDKTLFIDTGKAIAVSKNGLSESGVAVALELAKEKFGSTLNVKGTQAFKDMAIEVVAQKGLDIHFTDKKMNRRLAERKAELAIEREGQNISSADSARPVTAADHIKAFAELASDFRELIKKAPGLDAATLLKETQTLSRESTSMRNYWTSSDVYSPEAGPEKQCEELEKELGDIYGRKLDAEKVTTWFTERENSKPAFPVRTLEFEAAYAGIIDAYRYLQENAAKLPATELSKQFNSLRLERAELELVYHSPNHTPQIVGLESSLKKIVELQVKDESISSHKDRAQQQPASVKAPEQQPQQASKVIRHTGILLEHGAAPYQFKPDMTKPESERDDSYFVKLQQPGGTEKVVWGVTLESAVAGLELGERVSLTNQGKEEVQWEQQLANGKSETRQGSRVNWEGTPLDREVDNVASETYQEYEQWQTSDSDGPSVA